MARDSHLKKDDFPSSIHSNTSSPYRSQRMGQGDLKERGSGCDTRVWGRADGPRVELWNTPTYHRTPRMSQRDVRERVAGCDTRVWSEDWILDDHSTPGRGRQATWRPCGSSESNDQTGVQQSRVIRYRLEQSCGRAHFSCIFSASHWCLTASSQHGQVGIYTQAAMYMHTTSQSENPPLWVNIVWVLAKRP